LWLKGGNNLFKDVFGKALTGNNIFSLRNTRTLEDPTRMIEE